MNIVTIGGGTGLSQLLSGLKRFVRESSLLPAVLPFAPVIHDLTAVVTVTDDGGSSGRLRDEFQMLPPGDIRKCLVALSEDERLMSRLFQYRFERGGELQGHSFGNLFLTALTSVTGDFLEAIRLSSEVLAIKGRILPSTMSDVHLVGELENGASLFGESLIGRSPVRIRKIGIFPEGCDPLPETLEAIAKADVITLGPGSLYTSLLPNLLVNGIPHAIRQSSAIKIYIGNIMTQDGETSGFSAADHLRAVVEHCGDFPFDYFLCNVTPISAQQKQNYLAENAVQIDIDMEAIRGLGALVVFKDLLSSDDDKVRHDPLKLSQAVFDVILSQANREFQASPLQSQTVSL
ncbi:MAG: YvcK family protein [Acidobacteria bacterium]|nr:YvcK family protein [Acidobacteriota bacterium]MCI0721100.1 YvcK family protein [Acidobacteriota bacterium]